MYENGYVSFVSHIWYETKPNLEIVRILGFYAAYVGSYRRFGTTYPRRIILELLDRWRWDQCVVPKRR